MSIIQDIRDKYAKVAVVAIALALIGFILTDYFSGRGRAAGGGPSKSIGSVNGKNIDAEAFAKKVEQQSASMRDQGYPSEMASNQALSKVWEDEVTATVVMAEVDKLGMQIGKKELGDMLYNPASPMAADMRNQLTDSSGYDPIRAKQRIDQMLKSKETPPEQKDNFNNYVLALKQQRLSEKYVTLLLNSINYPKWFLEKQNADNSQIGKISMVRESYASIADSTVKLDDKEIADYISKHKNDFKQEESRSIAYVTFNAAPTVGDSAIIRDQLLKLKPEFDTTTDAAAFLAKNATQLADMYVNDTQMQVSAKKNIQRLAKNEVYGPYLDGNSYVMAKMVDTKILPDSVKCRHILLGVTDRQGQPIMPDSVAHAKADSVALAIRNGANFDTLETKYTTDQAAHQEKGVMTFSSVAIQGEGFAKEFGQFILFDGKPGDKKVIKTQFGWHYIEIMSFIKPQPAWKVAYLSQEILASPETDNKALEEATQFASDSRDLKGFDELFIKTQQPKGRTKQVSVNIRPTDAQLSGLGFARQMVRDIYKAEAGEVLKPERLNDNYVVAVVTGVVKEGTMSPASARQNLQLILQLTNKKKAATLKQKIGKVTTLEAAAVALGGKQIEPLDSLRFNGNPALGYEPRVIGATFNPANKGKVVPEVLEGINGVFVIRVENVSATPNTVGDIQVQRKDLYLRTKDFFTNPQQQQLPPSHPVNILKKTATVKDKRAERY